MDIFVGSLSFKTTEEELQREFEAFGEVESVKIILDKETLKSRGFAFVKMRNQNEALAAIAALNGKELNGFRIKVNESRPRDSRDSAPRENNRTGYPSSNRSGGGFGSRSGAGSSGGGYNKGWAGSSSSSRDLDIYDSKGGRSGGHGKKGRGGSNRGRSGGGKNSY